MERLEMKTTDDFNAAGGERAMSESARRLLAGAWFALAAAVPVAYYFLLNPLNGKGLPILGGSLILTVVVPIFIAGVCGLALGADILNREETTNAFRAAGRGLLVALLSYLVLFVGATLVLAAADSADVIGLIAVSAFFFFYGLIFIGWLIALVGAAAGGFLYLFGLKVMKLNLSGE